MDMKNTQSTRIFVSGEDIIENFENNLVTLKRADGNTFSPLEARRLFPVSHADMYITLLDASGKEIAVIRSLGDLNAESRVVIEESLMDYYLIPNIIKILSVSERSGTIHWQVETDRGPRAFDIRNRNHDIKVYSDGRVRLRDADDNRYIIKDHTKLDAHSRRFLISEL